MDFKPLDGRQFPRFSGIKTFFRLPLADVLDGYDVGIVGVPYDGGVTYRPGARFAAAKVREISSLGRGYHWSRGSNFFEKIKVADLGDAPTVPIDQGQTYERIESFFSAILKQKKKFVAVGGDHSITVPLLRAVHKHYGVPLQLVHFDAHLDTYPAAWGCEYHHGSFLRKVIEEKLVNPKKVFQIGIRGPLASGSDLDFVKQHLVRVNTVDDLRIGGLESFVKGLPGFDQTPTYISFDIDCLDPSCAPGTGTPVPGGLTTYEVQRIFRALKIPNLVAADVVEISPPYDISDITSLAGLDALFEILHLMAATESPRKEF